MLHFDLQMLLKAMCGACGCVVVLITPATPSGGRREHRIDADKMCAHQLLWVAMEVPHRSGQRRS
jgi:hypothetical protein